MTTQVTCIRGAETDLTLALLRGIIGQQDGLFLNIFAWAKSAETPDPHPPSPPPKENLDLDSEFVGGRAKAGRTHCG